MKTESREEIIHPHLVFGFHQLKLDFRKPLNFGEDKINPRNTQLGLPLTSRYHSFPPSIHQILVYIFSSNVSHPPSGEQVEQRKEKAVVVIWLYQIQYFQISKLYTCATKTFLIRNKYESTCLKQFLFE